MLLSRLQHKHCGFTLFELMTVLAIMSIVALMGTVSLLGFKQKHQAAGLANFIKSDLNRGKLLAAKYKSCVVLQIHEGFYELFIDNGAGQARPEDWQREGDEVRIVKRDIAHGLSLSSNFPGNHLRLRSSGRIRPGTFSITDRKEARIEVVVNAVGRVRLVHAG